MSAREVVFDLWQAGVSVRLAPDQQNLVVPAGRLTPDQRAVVLENKPALVEFLRDAHATTENLLVAAMKVCDRHGDNAAKRQEMREQCLALPPHLQADLLQYFKGAKQ